MWGFPCAWGFCAESSLLLEKVRSRSWAPSLLQLPLRAGIPGHFLRGGRPSRTAEHFRKQVSFEERGVVHCKWPDADRRE